MARKIWSIASKVIVWTLVAFSVFVAVVTVTTVATTDKNERTIFGLRFYIVQTDSMSKSESNAEMDVHFNAGDIIIAKTVKDTAALKAGEIISFMSANSESYGETVTHMIRRVEYNKDGSVLGYVTYGTNTGTDDETLVAPEYVLGVYAGKMPMIGQLFAYIKTPVGYILCILVPMLLLVLYNGVNVVQLFRRYKKEQTAQMDAQRAELAAERQRTEEMMRELMELKAQLTKKSDTDGESAPPDADTEA